MPEIAIIDLGHVTVDGDAIGSIFDLAWNRPQIEGVQSLTLAALQGWLDARDKAHADAMDALRTSLSDAHAAALADLQAKNDAALAARDAALVDATNAEKDRGKAALADLAAQHSAELAKCNESAAALEAKITQLEADVAERQNMINVLGGTDLGLQMRDEARKKELLAQKKGLDAQLKELGVEADT